MGVWFQAVLLTTILIYAKKKKKKSALSRNVFSYAECLRQLTEITLLSLSSYVFSSTQAMVTYIFLMQEIELVWKSFKKGAKNLILSYSFSSLIGYFKLTLIVFMEDWLLQRSTGNSWFLSSSEHLRPFICFCLSCTLGFCTRRIGPICLK